MDAAAKSRRVRPSSGSARDRYSPQSVAENPPFSSAYANVRVD